MVVTITAQAHITPCTKCHMPPVVRPKPHPQQSFADCKQATKIHGGHLNEWSNGCKQVLLPSGSGFLPAAASWIAAQMQPRRPPGGLASKHQAAPPAQATHSSVHVPCPVNSNQLCGEVCTIAGKVAVHEACCSAHCCLAGQVSCSHSCCCAPSFKGTLDGRREPVRWELHACAHQFCRWFCGEGRTVKDQRSRCAHRGKTWAEQQGETSGSSGSSGGLTCTDRGRGNQCICGTLSSTCKARHVQAFKTGTGCNQ